MSAFGATPITPVSGRWAARRHPSTRPHEKLQLSLAKAVDRHPSLRQDGRNVIGAGANSWANAGVQRHLAPSAHTMLEAEWILEVVTIQFDDLSAAFDFVSFAAPFEHRAFASLDTGAIYWISETGPLDEEDLPDDLETSERYIAIPHKNELDLGNNLALRFVEEQMPDRYTDVDGFFRRRGAYARFKELLAAEGCLEKWYAFEAESTERALRDWCKANEIHVAESGTKSKK